MMYCFISGSIIATAILVSSVNGVIDTGDGKLYTLAVTQDVWLESSYSNKNNYEFIIVGKHAGYPLKRSLLQFQNLPSSCRHIKWAVMYLYFVYAHKPSWMSAAQVPYRSRPLQLHQVKKQWSESRATSTRRLYGKYWSQPWLALDGRDADPNGILCEPVTVHSYRPAGFVQFDITKAVRNWRSGDPNYGLLLMATNENSSGRDFRFASNRNRSCYSNQWGCRKKGNSCGPGCQFQGCVNTGATDRHDTEERNSDTETESESETRT